MKTRLQLHQILVDTVGTENVYFRPPSKGMKYPCLLYDLAGDYPWYADNIPYICPMQWTLTWIDQNPDSEIPARLKQIPHCHFDRPYQAGGLNHFVFTLYY